MSPSEPIHLIRLGCVAYPHALRLMRRAAEARRRDDMGDALLVEPTDISFEEAIRFATDGQFDGYVAVGGGSSMHTAKQEQDSACSPAAAAFTISVTSIMASIEHGAIMAHR